jgi:hypothetical protein
MEVADALIQHHNDITATSKHLMEENMINKLKRTN